MVKTNSLINGIGNLEKTKNYYDSWSNKYDLTLRQWNYKAPKNSIKLLKLKLKKNPKIILDLACGTGLFAEEIQKEFSNCKIYGSDISEKSLRIAKNKKIYKKLIKSNFEKRIAFKTRFDLVSLIGAMTYCKNFNKLFLNVSYYLEKKGYFLFSHRIDLWKKQKFDEILKSLSNNFKISYISRPCNYLPLNKIPST